MAFTSFKDWRQKQIESSPQTRLMKGPYRHTSASPFTHSTPWPHIVKDMLGFLKDDKKKQDKKQKCESKKARPASHFDGNLDQWVTAADNLEKALRKLKDVREKSGKQDDDKDDIKFDKLDKLKKLLHHDDKPDEKDEKDKKDDKSKPKDKPKSKPKSKPDKLKPQKDNDGRDDGESETDG